MFTLTCGVKTVTLKNPELGNQEVINHFRSVNVLRSKELKVSYKSSKVKTVTHKLNFSNLTEAEKNTILDIIESAVDSYVECTTDLTLLPSTFNAAIIDTSSCIKAGYNNTYSCNLILVEI